jgi:hypothetical protein
VVKVVLACTLGLGIVLTAFLASACTSEAARSAVSPILMENTPATTTPTAESGPPLIQETQTPTIVWFPPTQTPTPLPTREALSPTPGMRPEVSRLLFEDLFEDSGPWTLTTRQDGRVSVGRGELTLAMQPSQTRGHLISLRQEPVLSDFYAEITANTTLCRGLDEYGLLVRASSTQDFFRFSLSCDGQARVDRLVSGQASSPQPWVYGPGVPPGAPGITRLGVWAKGREMRFFINDDLLFSVSDPSLPSGTLGVFARSTGENAVTVHFSDLVVFELEP